MPNIEKSLAVVSQDIISIMDNGFISNKLVIPGKGEIIVNLEILKKLPGYELLMDWREY
jgi:hypothetical protein